MVALWALNRSTTSWSATSVIRSQLTTKMSVWGEEVGERGKKKRKTLPYYSEPSVLCRNIFTFRIESWNFTLETHSNNNCLTELDFEGGTQRKMMQRCIMSEHICVVSQKLEILDTISKTRTETLQREFAVWTETILHILWNIPWLPQTYFLTSPPTTGNINTTSIILIDLCWGYMCACVFMRRCAPICAGYPSVCPAMKAVSMRTNPTISTRHLNDRGIFTLTVAEGWGGG